MLGGVQPAGSTQQQQQYYIPQQQQQQLSPPAAAAAASPVLLRPISASPQAADQYMEALQTLMNLCKQCDR